MILTKAMAHESKLIQTWGVNFTLSLDLTKCPLLSQPDNQFIFKILFESLKNMFLYINEEESSPGSAPKLLPLLEQFLSYVFEVLKDERSALFCSKVYFVCVLHVFLSESLFL